MLLHKCISEGEGQPKSQLNKKWEKKKVTTCHNDNDSLFVHPQGGNREAKEPALSRLQLLQWRLCACSSRHLPVSSQQGAHGHAVQAHGRWALPDRQSLSWQPFPKLMLILGWKWQISSAESESAGTASLLISLILKRNTFCVGINDWFSYGFARGNGLPLC